MDPPSDLPQVPLPLTPLKPVLRVGGLCLQGAGGLVKPPGQNPSPPEKGAQLTGDPNTNPGTSVVSIEGGGGLQRGGGGAWREGGG